MAQVKPMGLIESMSGKVCEHSDMYFFRKNGKVFSGKICNPSTKEPTSTATSAVTSLQWSMPNSEIKHQQYNIWLIKSPVQ